MLRYFLILAIAFASLALGTSHGTYLLSMFDGTNRLDVNDSTIPKGALISPSIASFIAVNILNDKHWGMINAYEVYFDGSHYYVVYPNQYSVEARNSFEARAHSYKICAKTGRLAVRYYESYEYVGYLMLTPEQFDDEAKKHKFYSQFTVSYGKSYDQMSVTEEADKFGSSANIRHIYYLHDYGEHFITVESSTGNIISTGKSTWIRI